MQKLNLKLIDIIKNKKCSSSEVNIINYFTRYQSEFGKISDVTYKKVCQSLNITKQQFYKSLYKLEEKEIIVIDPNSKNGFFNITIPLNDYHVPSGTDPNEFYRDNPYLNTNTFSFIYTDTFKKLHSNAMYLVLNLLKVLAQNTKVSCRKLKVETLKRYAGDITKRTLNKYLGYINNYFFINKDDKSSVYVIGIKKVKADKYSENQNRVWWRLTAFLDKYKIQYNSYQLTNTIDMFIKNGYEDKYQGLFHNTIIDTCFRYGMLKHKLINKTLSIIVRKNNIVV